MSKYQELILFDLFFIIWRMADPMASKAYEIIKEILSKILRMKIWLYF